MRAAKGPLQRGVLRMAKATPSSRLRYVSYLATAFQTVCALPWLRSSQFGVNMDGGRCRCRPGPPISPGEDTALSVAKAFNASPLLGADVGQLDVRGECGGGGDAPGQASESAL